jgi:signal transduction histidine kinase
MWRRRNPASLRQRLLLAAAALIAVALMLATLVIAFILQRFITSQIDGRLDSQIVFLASMLRVDDGAIALTGDANGPPFDLPPVNAPPLRGPPFLRPERGWYWEIIGPDNTLTSHALGSETITLPPYRPPPDHDRPAPAEARGPQNQRLHLRIQPINIDGADVTIIATAPRNAISFPLRAAMFTLSLSLTVLGIALVLAILFQVRLGLRPLERLRLAVAEIRAGRSDRLPETQPREIKPLAVELNALLEQNAAHLERARSHVANLAHGLKTPLTTLTMALAERDPGGDLSKLVALMERRIRHHLARARAAALSGPVHAQTPIKPRLDDLIGVLAKIYADKHIAVTQDVAPDLAVACEAQDFDELAGNLLDNAFKWARGHVALAVSRVDHRQIALTIADDGPGVKPEQIALLLRPGARADEAAPGFGFGLSIARELAELYGGGLDFATTASGGLAVTLRLPLAL